MSDWEKFIRDALEKTILSGEFEFEGSRKPSREEVARALEKRASSLASPEYPSLIRGGGLVKDIRQAVERLNRILAPVLDVLGPIDPHTGAPNVDLAGTIIVSKAPTWLKTWLGKEIREAPSASALARKITRGGDWLPIGSGATRNVFGNKNVVAKIEVFGGTPPYNLKEFIYSLILNKRIPREEAGRVIIPRPYALVTDPGGPKPWSILFSQRVPFHAERSPEVSDLVSRIESRLIDDGTLPFGFADVRANIGRLRNREPAMYTIFDLGHEEVAPIKPSDAALADILEDSASRPLRYIKVVR